MQTKFKVTEFGEDDKFSADDCKDKEFVCGWRHAEIGQWAGGGLLGTSYRKGYGIRERILESARRKFG